MTDEGYPMKGAPGDTDTKVWINKVLRSVLRIGPWPQDGVNQVCIETLPKAEYEDGDAGEEFPVENLTQLDEIIAHLTALRGVFGAAPQESLDAAHLRLEVRKWLGAAEAFAAHGLPIPAAEVVDMLRNLVEHNARLGRAPSVTVEDVGRTVETSWIDLQVKQPNHGDPVILWTRSPGTMFARYINERPTVPYFIVGSIRIWPEEEHFPVLWQPMPKAPTKAEVEHFIKEGKRAHQ